jgi:hypothetical protein
VWASWVCSLGDAVGSFDLIDTFGPVLQTILIVFLWPLQEAEACSCMSFPQDLEKVIAKAYALADVGRVSLTPNCVESYVR